MGGFASKPGGTGPEEVVVKPAASSSSRDEPAEPSPQAKIATFTPGGAAAGNAQPSQAPRQKPAAPAAPGASGGASLHVNRRIAADTLASEWDRALGSVDVALAEEEEMQRAIAASLREERSGGLAGAGGSGGNVAASLPDHRPLTGGSLPDEGGQFIIGKRPPDPKGPRDRAPAAYPSGKGPGKGHRPPDGASKSLAAGIGLAGDYAWVDNSDFHSPRVSQWAANRSTTRSASCGSRSHSNGTSGRSGIVSLPRIAQQLPAEQQAMVKDLHEKIKETISPHEDGESRGPLGKNASADVRRVMEDLNIDEPPLGRGLRGVSHEREEHERFNERFHSCSNAGVGGGLSPGAPPRYASPFRSDQRLRGPSL